MVQPELAVIVSTFERPGHLERCLASLEAQRGVSGQLRGGRHRRRLARRHAPAPGQRRPAASTFRSPSRPTSTTASGWPAAATKAWPPRRLPTCCSPTATASCPPTTSASTSRRDGRAGSWPATASARRARQQCRSTADDPAGRRFPRSLPAASGCRLTLKGLRAKFYEACRTPVRPRLSGNNIGIWRSDYERVNGFDEQFVGWGLEDRDLQVRLERLGLRAWSILLHTAPVHLWHPPAPSFARNNEGTANLGYFDALDSRPTFCERRPREAGRSCRRSCRWPRPERPGPPGSVIMWPRAEPASPCRGRPIDVTAPRAGRRAVAPACRPGRRPRRVV